MVGEFVGVFETHVDLAREVAKAFRLGEGILRRGLPEQDVARSLQVFTEPGPGFACALRVILLCHGGVRSRFGRGVHEMRMGSFSCALKKALWVRSMPASSTS